MKKFCIVLAAALMLSLSACGSKAAEDGVPQEGSEEIAKFPPAAEMTDYDEAEYWNETAGWLYYFTREKLGRSYLVLNDVSDLEENEKSGYAEAMILTLAYGPSGSTLFEKDSKGAFTGDAETVNKAASELFGSDPGKYNVSYLKDGKYIIESFDFDDYRPEAVTGAYGLSGSDPIVSGDVSITSNGEWLASQKFELKLKSCPDGKYSKYSYDSMEITWVDPLECVSTYEAKERREALLALTSLKK